MNILRSFQLSRDPNVNVANLIDELLSQNGDSVISIEDDGPYIWLISTQTFAQLTHFSAELSVCVQVNQ